MTRKIIYGYSDFNRYYYVHARDDSTRNDSSFDSGGDSGSARVERKSTMAHRTLPLSFRVVSHHGKWIVSSDSLIYLTDYCLMWML